MVFHFSRGSSKWYFHFSRGSSKWYFHFSRGSSKWYFRFSRGSSKWYFRSSNADFLAPQSRDDEEKVVRLSATVEELLQESNRQQQAFRAEKQELLTSRNSLQMELDLSRNMFNNLETDKVKRRSQILLELLICIVENDMKCAYIFKIVILNSKLFHFYIFSNTVLNGKT